MHDDKRRSPRKAKWMGISIFLAGATLMCGSLSGTTDPAQQAAWNRGMNALNRAARYMPRTAGMAAGFAKAPEATATAPAPATVEAPLGDASSPEAAPQSAPGTAQAPRAGRRSTVWDAPLSEVWPAENAWTPAMEAEYGRFVARIGEGFAARRCRRLDDCLLSPTYNTLYDGTGVRLGLHPDCADLAYELRAYFAFRRHLPFGWVRAMQGEGGDPRYLRFGAPTHWNQWTGFATPRSLFNELPSQVHSGMFRLSPKHEGGDTYAPRIDRASVRPGTNFYDTDGHVLVVSAVHDDGDVEFIDGHPDGSITHKHMNRTFIAGSAVWGGGFRNWRPLRLVNGRVVRARNDEIPDHAPQQQYDRSNYVVDGRPALYHEWIRARLTVRDAAPAANVAVASLR